MRNPDVDQQPGPDAHEDMEYPETKPAIGTSSAARNSWSRIRSHYLVSLTSRRPQRRQQVNRINSAAARALHGLKFISKADEDAATAWTAVARRFDELTCSTNGLLPHSCFAECIGMKESKEFAGALLKAVARRRCITEDSINKEQFKEIWDHIIDHGFHSRLQIFFDMVDRDADGTITEDEIKEIISWSASANKLPNIQKQSDEYARLIMEELDRKGHGHIMVEDLEMLLLQAPSHNTSAASAIHPNLSKILSEKLRPTEGPAMKRWWIGFWYSLIDNWRRVWVVALWIGAMAGLFGYKYMQYRRKAALFNVMGHCVCMAKGAAETLKLNMALILLPVCRNTVTWLRSKTCIGAAVPLGDNINFHKIIAMAIAVGVAIHSLSHLVCDYPRLLRASPEEFQQMERYLKHQPTSYWYFMKGCENVTGIAMVILMAVSYTLASPCLRRNRVKLPKPFDKLTGYNAFWYSHHLFVIVYVALVVHGIQLYLTHEWYKKTTWMYLAIPVVLYAGERLTRILRSNINHVKILKVELYPGDVLLLHLSKPPGFDYKSGQYIFVKCPAVSPFEWHPFSITSAPMDDYISVHIRILGDWTRQLKAVFTEFLRTPMQEKDSPNCPKVLIDGPYGAPTQDYKDYEVVLLVGLGIGATPMISVVKDIVNSTKKISKDHEEAMEEGRMTRHDSFKTKKAYFYWVARESGWFDWFKNVMNEVSEMDERGLSVIEMHSYCTSVYEEGDVRSALIAMVQSLSHAKNGMDIVSGTRVKSHFAKPKWRDVFKGLALNHPNSRIGVFYCGQPIPVKELKHLASHFSHKTSTEFEFHKENF